MSAADVQPQRVEIAIAVVERDGHFLIGLRPEGAALAGYWEFPGGKVLAGETPEHAAQRECLEETGLAVRVTGTYFTADHHYPHGRVRLHFLACAPEVQRSALPARFRWVLCGDLSEYRFPPANESLLRLLRASSTVE